MVVISRLRDAELDRRIQPLGLTIERYRALAVIGAVGPCAMSTFSAHSPLDRTTTTRLVDQLVRAGWVSRSKASDDRRQVYIALTDLGADITARAREIVSKFNHVLIDGIDDELQSQVIAMQLMLASKLEPRRGQFVDRQAQSEPNLSSVAVVS
jgi:DNA-binding MarR family transcriptional regulator